MERTIIHLVISFTFVSNGSYSIPLTNGKSIDITVAHATSGIATTGITGMKSHGNVQLVPDDPNGFMNVSDVKVVLPFQYNFYI